MRIFKGSRYTIKVLLTKCNNPEIEDVKISFHTTNPSRYVMVDKGIVVTGNVAEVTISPTLFNSLEDGLLIYTVYGVKDGIAFMGERQSNYYLKSNIYTPEEDDSCNHKLQNRVINLYPADFIEDITITPSEGYDGISQVKIYSNPSLVQSYALYQTLDSLLTNSENLSVDIEYNYMPDNSNSLAGLFDTFEPAREVICNLDIFPEDIIKCVYIKLSQQYITSISNMYTGNDSLGVLTFEAPAKYIEDCENAFKGFAYLQYLYLPNLGDSFKTPQTLDLTGTKIHQDNFRILAKGLYDFKSGSNKYGVSTSYVRGVEEYYHQLFEERGWQCID